MVPLGQGSKRGRSLPTKQGWKTIYGEVRKSAAFTQPGRKAKPVPVRGPMAQRAQGTLQFTFLHPGAGRSLSAWCFR